MNLPPYKYRGARALVILHDRHLRDVVTMWRKARDSGLKLPQTADTDYQSLHHLLRHILRAARGYMTWMCENLNLPDPAINPTPEADELRDDARVDAYLNHLLERWRLPLADVEAGRFDEVFVSRWNIPFSIDAMLEHAVMHPIRHSFQLMELIEAQRR